MALLDMAGLDIYKSVSSFLNADLSNRDDVAPMVLEKTAASKLGIKSGEGMFSYHARADKGACRATGAQSSSRTAHPGRPGVAMSHRAHRVGRVGEFHRSAVCATHASARGATSHAH